LPVYGKHIFEFTSLQLWESYILLETTLHCTSNGILKFGQVKALFWQSAGTGEIHGRC